MSGRSLQRKAVRELRNFGLLAFYLWICFAALVFLRDATLRFEGVSYLPWGFAAIKALIIAKFVMLGEMLDPKRREHERLVGLILRKSLLLLVLLVILTFIEDVAVSMIHGERLTAAITNAAARDAVQSVAKVLVMLLILIPYVGLRSLGEVLGEDRLTQLLVAPGADASVDQRPQGV